MVARVVAVRVARPEPASVAVAVAVDAMAVAVAVVLPIRQTVDLAVEVAVVNMSQVRQILKL